MKKQKGAALIVVLSMLIMSLMLGLSGMQSSLIDERLAGNYKAQSEAQMGAEKAASAGLEAFFSSDFDNGWVDISGFSVSNVKNLGWVILKIAVRMVVARLL